VGIAMLAPRTAADAQSSFLKLGGRKYLIISIVMVAVVVEIAQGSVERARIAVGACSEIARRLPALEEELSGRPLGSSLATAVRPEHLSHLTPIDDLRATAIYRRQAALVLLRRSLNRLRAA